MHVAAAELLGGDLLARRGLHQRRAAEEDRALLAHDHGLVAHRRHVGAARGAGAHDRADLRDPARGHRRLVEEDAAEVLAVGEDLVLHRQERAAGVDEVDARQPVVQRDLLRPQVLLDRHGVVGAALDGRVVGDDHAAAALDHADAGDDARAGRGAVVELLGGQRRELQERRARDRTAARRGRAASSLPREVWRSRARSPPPARTRASRCSRSSISARWPSRCPPRAAGAGCALTRPSASTWRRPTLSPDRHVEPLDRPGVRRGDRQLHLHRLDHEQHLALLDLVAVLRVDQQDGAGHRRLERVGAVRRRRRARRGRRAARGGARRARSTACRRRARTRSAARRRRA